MWRHLSNASKASMLATDKQTYIKRHTHSLHVPPVLNNDDDDDEMRTNQ